MYVFFQLEGHFNHTTISHNPGYDLHDDIWNGSSSQYKIDWDNYGQYSTTIFTDRAEQILEQHDSERPFFLFMSYQVLLNPICLKI